VSRGAKGARIVRRRGMTATPTARAIVRRPLGAKVSPREEDSVPAAQVVLDQVDPDLAVPADFALAAMAAVVDLVDSDRALVRVAPVVLAWDRAERDSFPKIRKWPR
jgi:hypothetical protein